MAVTELTEWRLPTLEIRGSNPVIDEILNNHDLQSTVLKRQSLRKKAIKNLTAYQLSQNVSVYLWRSAV